MKNKLMLLSLTALLSASTFAYGYTGSVGIGAGAISSPYEGVGSSGTPIPTINVQKGDFYIKTADVKYSLLSLGYNFYQTENVVLSAYANPAGGFDVDRSEMRKGYNNIDKREQQFEGGLKATINTGWNNVMVETYGTYGEEGGHLGASALRPVRMNEKLTLVPKVSLTYIGSDYADYYFGVTQSEVNRSGNHKITESYDADGAIALGLDLGANYALSPDVSIIGFVGVEKFSSEIDDSPIVEDSLVYKIGTGISYKF